MKTRTETNRTRNQHRKPSILTVISHSQNSSGLTKYPANQVTKDHLENNHSNQRLSKRQISLPNYCSTGWNIWRLQ